MSLVVFCVYIYNYKLIACIDRCTNKSATV